MESLLKKLNQLKNQSILLKYKQKKRPDGSLFLSNYFSILISICMYSANNDIINNWSICSR